MLYLVVGWNPAATRETSARRQCAGRWWRTVGRAREAGWTRERKTTMGDDGGGGGDGECG